VRRGLGVHQAVERLAQRFSDALERVDTWIGDDAALDTADGRPRHVGMVGEVADRPAAPLASRGDGAPDGRRTGVGFHPSESKRRAARLSRMDVLKVTDGTVSLTHGIQCRQRPHRR
jgi:hypothetical protein